MIRLIRKIYLIGGSVITTLVLIALVTVIVIKNSRSELKKSKFISNSTLGIYEKAAVSSNGPECAAVGMKMLKRNGSAVDAAIATLLCEGIASLHSMGLGGGFLMTIYDATHQSVVFLDARETAPEMATATMFGGNANLSLYGGLSIAVPGELMGYWEVHQKYGKLPWRDLFQPSIELCRTGSIVTKYLEDSLQNQEHFIRSEKTLADILINPKTNRLYAEGERIKRPILEKTLTRLANDDDPLNLFYNGTMRDELVLDLKNFGSIITSQDFTNYRYANQIVKWKKPIAINIGKLNVYTAPPPGSGILLAFMLNVLEDLVMTNNEKVLYQRIIEAFKWAYARRTELGDPDFVNIEGMITNLTSKDYAKSIELAVIENRTYVDPQHYGAVTTNKDDHGTAHVAILAPDGSAVSVTSTINQVLGSKRRSPQTGIIFNDEMDDFSSPNITNGFGLPPSKNNFIMPHKRPLSSMTPTIVLDENKKVRLIIGAAGGTKITTAVATIIILNLWKDYNIKEAIDTYRIHHQLFPMHIQKEKGFPSDILDYLSAIGHNITTYTGIGSAVTAVHIKNGRVTANSDYRRQGSVAGF
ncbi:PREDICTED: gamma-glutamyltranspeptidase 1-like [Ceratosolen solmsi marchali]|uniref:Gamma-glutamyltranspeptidase 1-like n=1 Tax=Ceratosolen solmsi marchali TaxID=326594 RepID=A0AAJ6YWR9_9HYME|nr:PREDICTED: gamma-glutamyltranspeptidase 1-like [Ceratosolen solmsi marchali]